MADVKELNINNTTYEIKAKSVVDTNTGDLKFWSGTKAQYDAIVTKDSDTVYSITDDTNPDEYANLALSNVNNLGTSRGAGWAMPSDTYVALTAGATGTTYTAPSDGYFYASGYANATSEGIVLYNLSALFGITGGASYTLTDYHCFIPVKKNDVVQLWFNTSTITFRFIYAKGSESEAS